MGEAARRQMRLVMSEALLQRLDRQSQGNRTRFILDAVRERLDRLESQELEAQMAEGYRTRAEEHSRWASETAHLLVEPFPPEGPEE